MTPKKELLRSLWVVAKPQSGKGGHRQNLGLDSTLKALRAGPEPAEATPKLLKGFRV